MLNTSQYITRSGWGNQTRASSSKTNCGQSDWKHAFVITNMPPHAQSRDHQWVRHRKLPLAGPATSHWWWCNGNYTEGKPPAATQAPAIPPTTVPPSTVDDAGDLAGANGVSFKRRSIYWRRWHLLIDKRVPSETAVINVGCKSIKMMSPDHRFRQFGGCRGICVWWQCVHWGRSGNIPDFSHKNVTWEVRIANICAVYGFRQYM